MLLTLKPSAYYLYVKTKISVNFQICISVPLKAAEHVIKGWNELLKAGTCY